MTHEENRIAADQLREIGKSRLHKDVQADAERLALYPRMAEALKQVVNDRYIVLNLGSVLLCEIDEVLREASKIK